MIEERRGHEGVFGGRENLHGSDDEVALSSEPVDALLSVFGVVDADRYVDVASESRFGVSLLRLRRSLMLGCSKAQPAAQLPAKAAAPGLTPLAAPMVAVCGMCDASLAVPIDAHRFLVANDEDNPLRVYDATRGGEPSEELDTSAELGVAPTIQR